MPNNKIIAQSRLKILPNTKQTSNICPETIKLKQSGEILPIRVTLDFESPFNKLETRTVKQQKIEHEIFL